MRDYTLEGGHFAEDKKEDEESCNGNGPEERREPLWWGHRLLHGFYRDISEAKIRSLTSRLS